MNKKKQEKIIKNCINSSGTDLRLPLIITLIKKFDFLNKLNSKKYWTFEEISNFFKINPQKLDVVISLCLNEKFIIKQNKKYCLTNECIDVLTNKGNYDFSSYYLNRVDMQYMKLLMLDIEKCLRTGKSIGWSDNQSWSESLNNPKIAIDFTRKMNDRGEYLAKCLAKKINLSNYSKLLDIGGSSGIYASEICKKNKKLLTCVFDLPAIINVTKKYIKKRKDKRIRTIAGDMFNKEYGDFDVHLYSNIFHDWNKDQINKLLIKSFKSLKKNGLLLVFDKFLNNKKDGSTHAINHSIVLSLFTDGRYYSKKETKDLISKVGFKKITYVPVFNGYGFFYAKK